MILKSLIMDVGNIDPPTLLEDSTRPKVPFSGPYFLDQNLFTLYSQFNSLADGGWNPIAGDAKVGSDVSSAYRINCKGIPIH
jgi:hypothetical protein